MYTPQQQGGAAQAILFRIIILDSYGIKPPQGFFFRACHQDGLDDNVDDDDGKAYQEADHICRCARNNEKEQNGCYCKTDVISEHDG
jgi:hypothetical protein